MCIAMQSPDGKCLRPSVSVGCLGLDLALLGPGAKTAILTRSVVRILLVCYFLQQTQYLTHHDTNKALLHPG